MNPAKTRFAFGMLALLVCVTGDWPGAAQTPSREVVELVSVVYKPARIEPIAVVEETSRHVPVDPPGVAKVEASADRLGPSRRLVQRPATPVVEHAAKAVHRHKPAATRSAKAPSTNPMVVRVACRPPQCHGPATKALTKRTATRRSVDTDPPLPAVLMPIRKLGLYLQTLGTSNTPKAAAKKRKR